MQINADTRREREVRGSRERGEQSLSQGSLHVTFTLRYMCVLIE